MSLLDTASLIVTPNGYKEGKLYSVIPSDGSGDMSVVRATTATRVNSAGLVELVPYNFVRYSQDFTNAEWTKLGTSLSVTGNTTIAPDGTLTADTLNVSNNNNILYQSASTGFDLTGNTYTFSIYAKGSGTFAMNVRLNSLTITTETKTLTSEWQRFQVSVTNSVAVTSVETYLELNTSSTYFVWGAQLVEGSTAKDYQKTETRLNIPRLDYSNGTCPSLLVEPQRTNLLTWSSSFNDSSWVKSSTTISANTTTSPSGIQDAETSVFNTSGQLYKVVSTTAICTLSIYVKKGTNRYFSIQLETNSLAYRAIYDLDTASVTFTGANTTATIEDAGSGWYRVTATNTTSDAIAYTTFQAAASGTSVGGSGTFYLWGAQLEVGAYPTSYIPTTSASVTRNADFLTRAGFGNTSTSGTLFFDLYAENIFSSAGEYILQLFEGAIITDAFFSTANSISIISNGTSIQIFNNGFTQLVQSITPTQGQRVKIAIRYNGTNISSSINGTVSSVLTDTSIGVKNAIGINNGQFSTHAFNAVAFFPSYLTNDQLTALTTI
jgi:hypothetical protein